MPPNQQINFDLHALGRSLSSFNLKQGIAPVFVMLTASTGAPLVRHAFLRDNSNSLTLQQMITFDEAGRDEEPTPALGAVEPALEPVFGAQCRTPHTPGKYCMIVTEALSRCSLSLQS